VSVSEAPQPASLKSSRFCKENLGPAGQRTLFMCGHRCERPIGNRKGELPVSGLLGFLSSHRPPHCICRQPLDEAARRGGGLPSRGQL
jgi:hypothetical protein